tara:strand:+ start:515 stop:640 length:126 start_codon:yes stop_codon:yes gene_type:complete
MWKRKIVRTRYFAEAREGERYKKRRKKRRRIPTADFISMST